MHYHNRSLLAMSGMLELALLPWPSVSTHVPGEVGACQVSSRMAPQTSTSKVLMWCQGIAVSPAAPEATSPTGCTLAGSMAHEEPSVPCTWLAAAADQVLVMQQNLAELRLAGSLPCISSVQSSVCIGQIHQLPLQHTLLSDEG